MTVGLTGIFVEDAEPFPKDAAAGGGERGGLTKKAGPDDVAVGEWRCR